MGLQNTPPGGDNTWAWVVGSWRGGGGGGHNSEFRSWLCHLTVSETEGEGFNVLELLVPDLENGPMSTFWVVGGFSEIW